MNVFRLSLTALLGLFLQAAFNPDRRQGIGFGAALAPWARLHGDDAERRAFLERHVKAFNTNPAMAAPILGAVARLETRAAAVDTRVATNFNEGKHLARETMEEEGKRQM